MPTVVSDAYTQLADVIEVAIADEFTDLPYLIIRHDRIHESMGDDGHTYVGISPEDEDPVNLDMRLDTLVQFYGPWDKIVDPKQAVDPRPLTNYAERMRIALQRVRTMATEQVWFFDVGRTRYPNDPTGNKTRFELVVTATGNNHGLLETTG